MTRNTSGPLPTRLATQHYTFAHLEQKTLTLTWRLGYTFTPTTTLQVYASPFISKGTYSDLREIGSAAGERCRTERIGRTPARRAEQSGWLQLPAVPIQRGVSLGVPAGLDPVSGLEPGTGGLGGRSKAPDRSAEIWETCSAGGPTTRS